jgi:hypothetical protein
MSTSCLLGIGLLLPTLALAESPMNFSSNLELWGYGSSWQKQSDSLLNPGNAIARLPTSQFSSEARGQVQGKSDNLDFTVRGRAIWQSTDGAPNPGSYSYVSQAFGRLRLGSSTSISAGRMLLTWGPGQLRSPSNPFYFDAGKTDPMLELSGIGAASVLYSGDDTSVQVARIFDNGNTGGYTRSSQGENFNGSQTGSQDFQGNTLLKLDNHGSSLQSSLVLTKKYADPLFVGAYAQWTASDALLLYAEFGSGSRPQSLLPDSYQLVTPSPRASTALLGSSYTLENGQTIYGEFLYDGHGYSRNDEKTYFAVARQADTQMALDQAAAALLGKALGTAPVLLGRRYASAIWQSNPQESGLFWQGIWTANAEDRSQQVIAYLEWKLTHRVSLFGDLSWNLGGRETEFGALTKSLVQLGVKVFMQ